MSPKYRRPVLIAALLHAVLVFVLIFSFVPSSFRMPDSGAPMKTIQAVAIMQPDTQASVTPPKPVQPVQPPQKQPAVQQAAQQQQEQQKEQQKQVLQKQLQEQAMVAHQQAVKEKQEKAAAEKKVLLLEQEKQAKQSQLQAEQQAEKAKLAKQKQEKAQKALEKKAALQKKLQQEKAAAKMAKLAKEKALQVEQAKLQKELMQQQMTSEAHSISTAEAQAQAAAAQAKAAAAQALAQQGAIDKYKAAILSTIQSNWRIDQVNSKLKCVYSVQLAPDGTVLSVRLVQSSGDAALDQSAQQAITLSSPLPVPNNPGLFDHFRRLILTLSPQGYLQSVNGG